jgi:nucleoside-diphosphate-sugar epimerase
MSEQFPTGVIIFGCGYVGSALAEALIARGVRVGALTRNAQKAEQLRAMGVTEVVVAQLESNDWHAELNDRYAAVVNCVSSAGGGIAGYRQSYLEGQASILKWVGSQTVERYIYTSSTSVYPQDGGVWVDESAATDGAPETGQVLLESESLLAESSALSAWYVLRLAGIYGPGRHYLLDTLRRGEKTISGAGDYSLNVIHLNDIVSAMLRLLSAEVALQSGIYNLADDAPTTKAEMVAWLSEQLKVDTPCFDPNSVSPRLKRRGGHMPNRRISNKKFKAFADWELKYPDYRAGYANMLE